MEITQELISTAASLGSFTVALFATGLAYIVHKTEKRRSKNASLKEEQEQANLVAAWEVSRPLPIEEVPKTLLDDSQRENYGNGVYATAISMTIANRSNQPVYDFEVNVEGFENVFTCNILPPGEQNTGTLKYSISDYYEEAFDARESLLNLSFRDASGIWWVRKAQGMLMKVTSDDEHDIAMGPAYQAVKKLSKNFRSLGAARIEASDGSTGKSINSSS